MEDHQRVILEVYQEAIKRFNTNGRVTVFVHGVGPTLKAEGGEIKYWMKVEVTIDDELSFEYKKPLPDNKPALRAYGYEVLDPIISAIGYDNLDEKASEAYFGARECWWRAVFVKQVNEEEKQNL